MITQTSRTLAKEVIEGKWGNGNERFARLTAAGYNAQHIQDVVNEMYINGEVDEHGKYIGLPVMEENGNEENLNFKEVEIDMTGFDGLKITLVV